MAHSVSEQPQEISLSELEQVLARAQEESWTSLALVSRRVGSGEFLRQLPAGRTYILDGSLQGSMRPISRLTQLSSLALVDLRIGADGARALASLTSLTSLDLGGNGIGDDGARALASLTSLTSLDLWGNEIGADGARALVSLTSLTSLTLGGNGIGADGARALASLTSLTSLNLGDNGIGADGARALASLTSLTSLNLGGNGIGADGARALASLTSLTSLNLEGNGIGADGARALASLTSLTSLKLGGNRIRDDGARALASLTSLTSLDLWNNGIGDDGARALASLTSLTSLDLRYNGIGDDGARALLAAWTESPTARRLTFLDLRENRDLSSVLPAETLDTTDAQAILAAYRRYRSAAERETLRPLNEAKLLVVGNEAVGKTSLIRYLVENMPCDPNEKKTPGTAIHVKIDTRQWSPGEDAVTLNIWDFGGQAIMHGTHRYFLTERSLYLLVLEDRRQDDRSVYDWLKIIRNRGRESPVIVVINKSDAGKQDLRLDENGLQHDYPSIVAFVRSSCAQGEFAAATIQKLRGRHRRYAGE